MHLSASNVSDIIQSVPQYINQLIRGRFVWLLCCDWTDSAGLTCSRWYWGCPGLSPSTCRPSLNSTINQGWGVMIPLILRKNGDSDSTLNTIMELRDHDLNVSWLFKITKYKSWGFDPTDGWKDIGAKKSCLLTVIWIRNQSDPYNFRCRWTWGGGYDFDRDACFALQEVHCP